jgi:hypothetical protein
MAPPGKAVVHAYYAGSEPYSLWEDVKRGSEEYKRLKEERSEPLWKVCGLQVAVQQYIKFLLLKFELM